MALGLTLLGVGLIFGLEHHFSNWGVVVLLMALGAALLLSGLFVPEHYWAMFFMVCVVLNMVAAGYAFIFGDYVQP